MPLRLDKVGPDEQSVLENLLQLYIHELCQYNPVEIGENGRYRLDKFESYFNEPGRFPLLIRVKGRLAGFVLVRQVDNIAPVPTFAITDFFLLENYRRLGIGEEIARLVFEEYHGHWQIGVHGSNQIARDFFRQVLYRYTGNHFRTTTIDGFDGPVYLFQSPAPRPKERAAETALSPLADFLGQSESQ